MESTTASHGTLRGWRPRWSAWPDTVQAPRSPAVSQPGRLAEVTESAGIEDEGTPACPPSIQKAAVDGPPAPWRVLSG